MIKKSFATAERLRYARFDVIFEHVGLYIACCVFLGLRKEFDEGHPAGREMAKYLVQCSNDFGKFLRKIAILDFQSCSCFLGSFNIMCSRRLGLCRCHQEGEVIWTIFHDSTNIFLKMAKMIHLGHTSCSEHQPRFFQPPSGLQQLLRRLQVDQGSSWRFVQD